MQPSTAKKARGKAARDDYDLDSSSPAAPAPQLHSEIFDTPARKGRHIPGISVLTPAVARGRNNNNSSSSAAGESGKSGGGKRQQQMIWDSDSDDDDDGGDMGVRGMSPPKTMQFHVPQPRLLRTPAREASKRIVEDLLLTAGGGDVTDDLEEEEDSPSVIQRARLGDEDTF